MADGAGLIPALVLLRQLEALAHLGLDVDHIRARVGHVPAAADAMVPVRQYNDMWSAAQALYGLPGLPTALGMAIPFGAFGAIDYLAGSAETIGALCESLVLHFSMVSIDTRLHHERLDDGAHVLEVRGVGDIPGVALEFALATLVGRLRYVTRDAFAPDAIALPAERPVEDSVRARLWRVPITYAYPCASCTVPASMWALAIGSADPYLHATLKTMAEQLELVRPRASDLEQALRIRLRDALAQGRADPERLAGLLGVSERTLQRRLQDIGRSFSAVVEDFRREEAARLLQDRKLHLVQIAARLGYAEQTSFTRAFRRWTGETPGAWRAARLSGQA